MATRLKNKVRGFPLSEFTKDLATKADLFLVTSALFRICIQQNVALKAIRDGQLVQFEEEIKDADDTLNQLYDLLQADDEDDDERR